MSPTTDQLQAALTRLEQEVSDLRTRVRTLESGSIAAPVAVAAPALPPQDLETRLGTYWLPRVGILALITGIAFLVVYRFRDLGVTTAIVLGYAVAAALGGGGLALVKRHPVLGQVLVGGGLAVAYFVTFALHFVPAVRVIESPTLALALLGVVVAGIVFAAQALRSETVAGIALFLGLHTGLVGDVGHFTLLSSLVLAVGALFFLVRNRWVVVPTSTLVAVYATHVVWALRHDAVVPGAALDLTLSLSFLAAYHLLFTAALVLRPAALPVNVLLLFATLNWLGVSTIGVAQVLPRGGGSVAELLAIVAAVQVAASVLAGREGGSQALSRAWLVLAGLSAFVAIPAQWEGNALVTGWMLLAAVLVLVARTRGSAVLQLVGTFAAASASLVAGLHATNAPWLVATAVAVIGLDRLQREVPDGHLPVLRAIAAISSGGLLLRLGAYLAPEGLVTAAWVAAAFGLFALGFVLREAWYRYAALGGLLAALVRLFLADLSGLSPDARIVTFLVIGTLLLVVSYVYSRVRHRSEDVS